MSQMATFNCRNKLRSAINIGQQIYSILGCLRSGVPLFNWWVSFASEFQCCYFYESSCLFYLSYNYDFYVSKIMHS